MFLNIITPCIRPENLHAIAQTIPQQDCRWIVVFDMLHIPTCELPSNAEYYAFKENDSISGNGQRNFALDMVTQGHVYFNDDDTLIHPDLWRSVQHLGDIDFISFPQVFSNGAQRLSGNRVEVCHIDSHNFIASMNAIGDTRWILGDYCADGHFAAQVYKQARSTVWLETPLSVYNALR
jgi:hypothetical protein